MDLFYIASLKHTGKEHEHITWWGVDHRGYTPVLGEYAGQYTQVEAARLNDGLDCIAVPVEAVKTLMSSEPYYRPHDPARFYDQRGPVVDNSRANWNRLIALSLKVGRAYVPKPTVFRGTRRAFSMRQLREAA